MKEVKILSPSVLAGTQRSVHEVRAEYGENPVGLGEGKPRLSWKLPEGWNVRQEAYQLRAASTPELLASTPDLFDTGRCVGSESVFVPWPGHKLASRQQAYWQVRVWLEGMSRATPWSRVAGLETGLLKKSDWTAQWISLPGSGDGRESGPASYLARDFFLPSLPVRARLYATALGLFELHLNGRPVHPKQVLIPGWSDFRHRAQVLTFDVTEWLREGANRLGAILGDGWYAGYLGPDRKRKIYGGDPALLLQLEVLLADGRWQRVGTDGQWQGAEGPILSSDLYNGEIYDARRELPGWSTPGSAVAGWEPVRLRQVAETLILDPKVAEPVARTAEIKPVKLTEPAPDVYLFDLGQNFSGWARLKWSGHRGQTVRLRFGEMLNADGTLYTDNLRTAKATDLYTFGADGTVTWEPRFTYHGFRYVELTGTGRPPDLSAVTGIVLHSAMRPTGEFRCSNRAVNRLARNIRWGQRSNFLEIPADCPQRDERLGWSGDIQIFAKTACFHYDADAFLVKWLRDLRDGQTADGAYPDIAPTFICGFGNAAWADAGVIVPWVLYRRYGDTGVLRENYRAMTAWMRYQQRTSRRLVRPPTAYGDWLAIDAVIPEHAPVPSDLVGTAYFARTASILERIAAVLGRDADRRRFAKLHESIRTAFQREFVTASGRVVGDCQTAYLLALAFDLLPVPMRAAAVERLVELIRKRNWKLSTGFVGTPLLCPVLTRFGRHDVAMKLLLQSEYPSWLFTVKNGATTMWERWNSYTPEKGFGDVVMNSFNHYAYGAVGEWLVHDVAGLAPNPGAPAYRQLVFRPRLCPGLNRVHANLETPYGLAAIAWETRGERMRGRIVVPPNTSADFAPVFAWWKIRPEKGEDPVSSSVGRGELGPGHYLFEAGSTAP